MKVSMVKQHATGKAEFSFPVLFLLHQMQNMVLMVRQESFGMGPVFSIEAATARMLALATEHCRGE